MSLWNAGGICFSRTPGMISGPEAFCLGSRRNVFWKIAAVRLPMTMFFARGRVVWYCVVPGEWVSGADFSVWGEGLGLLLFYYFCVNVCIDIKACVIKHMYDYCKSLISFLFRLGRIRRMQARWEHIAHSVYITI